MCEMMKPDEVKPWQIYRHKECMVFECEGGIGMCVIYPDEESAVSDFKRQVRQRKAQGWTESERSLSRRIFLSEGDGCSNYWIIWLDDNKVAIRYGKVPAKPRRWCHRGEPTRVKEFQNRPEALQSYAELIATKIVEGYVEAPARKGPYAKYGRRLAKKMKAKLGLSEGLARIDVPIDTGSA